MTMKAISTAALPLRRWPGLGEWTYEDYRQLPDDGYIYEIIEGELYMTPAPNIRHQRSSGELQYALQSFVKQNDLGIVLDAPCDLILPGGTPVQPDIMFIEGELYMTPAPNIGHQRSSRNLEYALWHFVKKNDLGEVLDAPCDLILPGGTPVQPDIMFIAKERLGIITEQAVQGVPDLLIEILSPASREHDRVRKFGLYEQAGVPEYWLVDPNARTIEIFVLGQGKYSLNDTFEAGTVAVSKVLAGFSVAVDEVIPL